MLNSQPTHSIGDRKPVVLAGRPEPEDLGDDWTGDRRDDGLDEQRAHDQAEHLLARVRVNGDHWSEPGLRGLSRSTRLTGTLPLMNTSVPPALARASLSSRTYLPFSSSGN